MEISVKQEPKISRSCRSSKPASPSLPPYLDADFQHATGLAVEDAQAIRDVYRSSQRKPPQEHIDETERLVGPITTKRQVGVVGASSAGKSSLICSILDTEGIAVVDSAGEAVTCFPVHYQYKLPEHTAKYTIQCVFPRISELGKVLGKFLRDMNAPYQYERQDWDPSDWHALNESSEAAEATFEALFKQMADFELEKLMIGREDVTEQSATAALSRWSSQLPWPQDLQSGIWSKETDTEEKLQSLLGKFRENGLWPLVERLTIFLDASLLRNGIILVDLPGYHDANFARVRIARETQAKCDDLFVVANIVRASDNPILRAIIEENMTRPGVGMLSLQTITAVCTHSAKIEKDTEKLANPTKLAAAKKAVEEMKANGAHHEDIKKAKWETKALTIEARNRGVKATMQERYGSMLNCGQFSVFCVDNTLYMAHKGMEEVSGIPELQSHVEQLPAKTLFRLYNAFIGSHHHAMVASFETWVSSSRPRAGDLKQLLPEPMALRAFRDELKLWGAEITDTFHNYIITPILGAEDRIIHSANMVTGSWGKLPYTTINAVCRREGKLEKSKRGPQDWNQELTECFNRVAGENWRIFDDHLRTSLAKLNRKIFDAFQEYPRTCQELGAPPSLLRSLTTRQQTLDDAAGLARDNFRHEVGLIKRNATISRTDCYARKYMLDVYQGALEITGEILLGLPFDVILYQY